MPSTRKQRAKERRSTQLDKISDVENVDILLGSYSRGDERIDQSENELHLDSGSNRPQQNSNMTGEDFRSLLNTNSRENSEMTIQTTRMISDEISSQVTRKFNDNRSSLNLQIEEAINAAITEKVLPSIENSLVAHERANLTMEDQRASGLQDSPRASYFTLADQRSSGLLRNSEVTNPQKTKKSRLKMGFSLAHQREMSRDCSVDSYTNERNRDTCYEDIVSERAPTLKTRTAYSASTPWNWEINYFLLCSFHFASVMV